MLQKGQIQPQMYLPSFQTNGQQQQQGGLPTEQPGTGGPAVNAPTGQDMEAQSPAPGSPEADASMSRQLLQSVPIK
jgi:hypothetical protein